MRRSALTAFALALACTSSPPPQDAATGLDAPTFTDAGRDANLPAPVPLMIARDEPASGYRLEVDTDPLGFRLLDASGTPVVRSAGLGLAVGLAHGGDRMFHEPMNDTPAGLRWSPLGYGVSRTSGTEAVVRDAEGNLATIELTSESAAMVKPMRYAPPSPR